MFGGDRDDYLETLPRRSLTTKATETTSIAWIELSSIRAIEVVSVVRVVNDRLGSVFRHFFLSTAQVFFFFLVAFLLKNFSKTNQLTDNFLARNSDLGLFVCVVMEINPFSDFAFLTLKNPFIRDHKSFFGFPPKNAPLEFS